MNTTTRDAPLDGFELSLLTALREVAAAQGAATAYEPVATPARMPHGPLLRRPAVRLAAAAAAVATGVGAYLVSPAGTSPAFAVTTGADGDVTVTVNRLDGAASLEKALKAAGITADVTFPARGNQCRVGRYADAPPSGAGGDRVLMSATSSATGGQSITIPKGAIGPGQTFVLESMWPSEGTWAMRVGIAQGPVGACVEEDYTPPPGMVNLHDVPPGGQPTTTTSGEDLPGSVASPT